eukprot:TRINITY_DN72918_c0_g1_i1.p1 TRINITY_DN72918_c0_g1~~TRINITY_DN72918_c0_g1_i1.p1  ORF type:complete len:543 (-),score=140.13 TRINITY_DN72918_c0_g1_i1:283-1911(-)
MAPAVQAREAGISLLDMERGGQGGQSFASSTSNGDQPMIGWNGQPIEINEYGLPVIWTYEPPELPERPERLQWVRKHAFNIFLATIFGGTIFILILTYMLSTPEDGVTLMWVIPCSKQWKDLFKYMSIPLVSVIFTWWHVYLGIKMCFYPVEFVGCLPPVCGWQGIVPRRAHIMAARSCDIMIGKLLKIEEIIDRIKPESFFRELMPVLVETTAAVVDNLANQRCPGIWEKLPADVKEELQEKILEQAPMMFEPVIKDVKQNINRIVDVKAMAIQILVENKPLLVEMFQKIGAREFVFIQHFSAVLGFILGVFQMFSWILINSGSTEEECKVEEHKHDFHCWAGFVVLPVSGLVIGYLTNWLGINLIFRPVWPHIYCGGYVNVQGVFLKRQTQVSHEMTRMICAHLVTARKMLEYVAQKEEILQAVIDIFRDHVNKSIDKSTAAVRPMVQAVAGKEVMDNIRNDVVREMLLELPNHSKQIEEYMDAQFDLVNTMSYRLSHLPPSDFEGMLHPVFQEDEWMVLLLGGVLGVIVGTLQAFALGS